MHCNSEKQVQDEQPRTSHPFERSRGQTPRIGRLATHAIGKYSGNVEVGDLLRLLHEGPKRDLAFNALLTMLIVLVGLLWWIGSSHAYVNGLEHSSAITTLVYLPTDKIAVFGKDTRTTLPEKYKTLENSIGLLSAQRGRSIRRCSAFCVAPEIVATAAHCLLYRWNARRRWPLSSVVFRVGRGRRARSARIAGGSAQALQWNVIGGATEERIKPLNSAHDWAVVRLEKPVCRDRILRVEVLDKWTKLRDAVTQNRIYMIAYHSYKRKVRLRYSADCGQSDSPKLVSQRWGLHERLAVDAKHLLQHTCDLTKGASGSPLLLDSANGPVVIAINVIEFPLTRVLPQIKKNLPKNLRKQSAKIANIFAANSAVISAAFHEQIELLQRPPRDVMSKQIRAIQAFLRSTGDYQGKIDGIYGAGTRQAALDLERRKSLLPTGRPPLRLAALHFFASGANSLKMGRFDKAVNDFDQAIELNPSDPKAYSSRGYARHKMGEYEPAIADFSRAIEVNPRYARAYLRRGLAYQHIGQYKRAIADLDLAIEIKPNYSMAYNNRGYLNQLLNQPSKAIDDYRKALSINPNNQLARTNLRNMGDNPYVIPPVGR